MRRSTPRSSLPLRKVHLNRVSPAKCNAPLSLFQVWLTYLDGRIEECLDQTLKDLGTDYLDRAYLKFARNAQHRR